MISLADGKKLLNLAKESVRCHFSEAKVDVDSQLRKRYSEKQGVFVTLHKDKELCGCIGFPEPVMPLVEAIIHAAESAAFSDPRFNQLQKEELKEVVFEISILTVPKKIEVNKPEEYLEKIKIGRDGLIIKGSYGSGLLLPQVFTEYKCTPQQALEMTCQKAMMPADAWKDLSNILLSFSAQIFAETNPNGAVVEKRIGE